MNKAELTAHVAAETFVTRATADRPVGAVFSAIADALARDATVANAGFGKFPGPASPSPSRLRGHRRSSPRKRSAKRSTNSSAEPDPCPPFVPPARVCRREELGGNVEIRYTCELVRRSAADIGSLARGDPYMAGRRIAPTTALRANARG